MSDIPVTQRSRVKRHHERGHYDRETVNAILDAALICHLGFVHDGHPVVIPTAHWREGDHLYVHGSSASRTLRALGAGIPVSVAVSLLDGLVLARSAFHHSLNFRSVVVFGQATPVTEPDQKTARMKAFVERVAPKRWDEIRPPTDQELKATSVLHIPLDEVSAKVRTGPPIDDEADYALACWAGVVPVRAVTETPEPDDRLPAGTPLPAQLGKVG